MEEKDIYKIAGCRANRKFGFYIHSTVFILVNAVTLLINLLTTPWFIWAAFPFLGWGLGVTIHGLAVFVFGSAGKRLLAGELRLLQPPAPAHPASDAVSSFNRFGITQHQSYQPGGDEKTKGRFKHR